MVNNHLVGGLEPWSFMTFHSVGNFIFPTDFHIFQRGRLTANRIWSICLRSKKQPCLVSNKSGSDWQKIHRSTTFASIIIWYIYIYRYIIAIFDISTGRKSTEETPFDVNWRQLVGIQPSARARPWISVRLLCWRCALAVLFGRWWFGIQWWFHGEKRMKQLWFDRTHGDIWINMVI